MFKRKKHQEDTTPTVSPYDRGQAMGFSDCSDTDIEATVNEFRDLVDKNKKAYEDYDDRELFWSSSKNRELRKAYNISKIDFNDFCQGLREGAFDAFLDGRPERLQAVLAHPESFAYSQEYSYEHPDYIRSELLRKLFYETPDAAALQLALAKTPAQEKQACLDEALLNIINGITDTDNADLPARVTTLLDAGAKASPHMLVCALYGQHLDVAQILRDHGVSDEEALQDVHDSPLYGSSDTALVELTLYKEQAEVRIRELEETVRELTEGKPAPAKSKGEPAPEPKEETPAPVTRISGFRKPAP